MTFKKGETNDKNTKHDKHCHNDKQGCQCESDKCSCEEHNESLTSQENLQEALNYLEMAQRIQAEFDNYRKRTKLAEIDARTDGIILAVEKFLPIIDSIDNAKRQVEDEVFTKALELINSQLMQSLKDLNIEKIESVGKVFDPHFHNAVLTGNDSSKSDDEILEEFQAGFTLNGKVIRHSVVKVNKL